MRRDSDEVIKRLKADVKDIIKSLISRVTFEVLKRLLSLLRKAIVPVILASMPYHPVKNVTGCSIDPSHLMLESGRIDSEGKASHAPS